MSTQVKSMLSKIDQLYILSLSFEIVCHHASHPTMTTLHPRQGDYNSFQRSSSSILANIKQVEECKTHEMGDIFATISSSHNAQGEGEQSFQSIQLSTHCNPHCCSKNPWIQLDKVC